MRMMMVMVMVMMGLMTATKSLWQMMRTVKDMITERVSKEVLRYHKACFLLSY